MGGVFSAGDADLVIKSDKPLPVAAQEYGVQDRLAPQQPFDITDKLLRASRNSQLLKMQMGMGRGSTFLTGPAGDTSEPTLGKTLLGGVK